MCVFWCKRGPTKVRAEGGGGGGTYDLAYRSHFTILRGGEGGRGCLTDGVVYDKYVRTYRYYTNTKKIRSRDAVHAWLNQSVLY